MLAHFADTFHHQKARQDEEKLHRKRSIEKQRCFIADKISGMVKNDDNGKDKAEKFHLSDTFTHFAQALPHPLFKTCLSRD